MEVVGSGNIDVGNATPPLQRRQPAERHGEIRKRPANFCGAMSQQGGEFRGNVSSPQKLVRLIGCRERTFGLDPQAAPISKSGQTGSAKS
jgi:hypothetical protein